MTTTRTMLIAILALAVLPPALAAGDTPPAAASGFNGAWTLDAARSDDPAKLMPKPAAAGERPGGKGGGPGMGGGPGRGGGGGGGMGGGPGMGGGGGQGNTRGGSFGGERADQQRPGGGGPPELAGGRKRLVIFHERQEFDVTDAMEITQSLTTDGRKSERWTHRGQIFESARVEGGKIVVRSEDQTGGARTTVYELSADGNELTVVMTFKPPLADKEVALRSVYTREAGRK